MSKLRVVVLKVVAGQLSVSEAAEQYQVSRQYLLRFLTRHRAERARRLSILRMHFDAVPR